MHRHSFQLPASNSMFAGRGGFSLVEVLVSTAILLVIVVMVSMVFQQQSAAFQSGGDRVKGQAALRSAMGMIVRDLSQAVDSTNYPGIEKNSFGGSKLEFLAMTGEAGYDAEGKPEKSAMALQRITYSGSSIITREAQSYGLVKGGWTKAGSVSKSQINGSDTSFSDVSYSASESGTFPSNITIRASHRGTSSASSVKGQSAGPDKQWDTKDDIYVGGK